MAKIAIACSCVAASDNAFDSVLIGRALTAAGHDVLYLADDIGAMHRIAASTQGLAILQAPLLQTATLDNPPPDKPEGFAAQLAQAGYADLGSLRPGAGAWTALLRAIKVDCIIGIATPIAWLVGPHIAPTFAAGRGRHLPAMPDGNVVFLPDEAPAMIDQATLVANANSVLGELDLGRIDGLADVLGRCGQWHYGLDSFDPYRHFRRTPGFGPLGAPPTAFAEPDRNKRSLFLDAHYPGIEAALLAMVGLGDLRLDVFVQNATPAMSKFLSGLAHVVLHPTLDAALAASLNGAAIIHHGTPVISEHGVLQGRPHLVLPWTTAHWNTLEHLKILGVAWWKEPGKSIQELVTTFRSVGHDADIAIAAERTCRASLKQNIGGGAAAIAAAVEKELAPTLPPQPTIADSGSVIGKLAEKSPYPHSELQKGTFCGLPFEHLCITTEATAKVCCVSQEYLSEDGVPLTLYRNGLDDIWNSAHMRDIRQAMAEGRPLKECEVCYANERATGQSYRTSVGILPFGGRLLDSATVREAGETKNYRASNSPSFIKLELGNLCNLKCRMCNGGNSSEIERDPVHSRWNGGDEPLHAVWRGGVAVVGPASRIGVKRAGIYEAESASGKTFSWTDGRATLEFPVGTHSKLTDLEIECHAAEAQGQSYYVRVNGQALARGDLNVAQPIIRIELTGIVFGQSAKIEIESSTRMREGDLRPVGLPLVSVKVKRKWPEASAISPAAEVLDLKLSKPGLWYHNDDLVFGKLLGDLSRLERFFVTGGEPFLEPRFFEILDWLIERGAASRIDLEVVTNGTRFDEKIATKLAPFRSLHFNLSIDGTGDIFDYMRYPARWNKVAENIKRIRNRFPIAEITAIPVIQAYNVLNIVDICRFSAENGIAFLANFIQTPSRLKVENQPATVVRTGGRKLREYVETDCPDTMRIQLEAILQYLETCECGYDPALLREFMLFTNDLDRDRNQSMRTSLPELYSLLMQSGFKWTDEVTFTNASQDRRSARDRIHAWV